MVVIVVVVVVIYVLATTYIGKICKFWSKILKVCACFRKIVALSIVIYRLQRQYQVHNVRKGFILLYCYYE